MARDHARWLAGLLALALLAGCPSKRRGEEESMGDVSAMADGFDKARAAFVHHAAARLGAADDQIRVLPNSEAEVDIWAMPGRAPGFDPGVGGAWAFEARQQQPSPPVRGWATPDGGVLTHDGDLGPLLEQAGLWSGDAQAAFAALAPRLIWSLGPPHEPGPDPAPTLTLAEDGSGQATLSTRLVIPGGPTRTVTYTLSIRADHSASLASP